MFFFFFQAEDGIRDTSVTGVQTCALPIYARRFAAEARIQGFDVLVCYGGDGTAMQIAAGAVGSGIPLGIVPGGTRSEERRVGKECRSRWLGGHERNNKKTSDMIRDIRV